MASSLQPTFIPHFHLENAVSRMKYKQLGDMDMSISNIALGCLAIDGFHRPANDTARKIVTFAVKNGINFIDTSCWYSQRRCEKILGKILVEVPRQAYFISCSVGKFYLDYAQRHDYCTSSILNSIDISLKNLKLPYADVCFLQINSSAFENCKQTIVNETLPALQGAKEVHKIRYIGLASYSMNKLQSILESSDIRIDAVLVHRRGNLVDGSLGVHVHALKVKNIGVINGDSLCHGLLSTQGLRRQHHSISASEQEAVSKAIRYCIGNNVSVEKLALDYAINFPHICSCLVDMNTVEQVKLSIELACSNQLSEIEVRVRDRILRRYLERQDHGNVEMGTIFIS